MAIVTKKSRSIRVLSKHLKLGPFFLDRLSFLYIKFVRIPLTVGGEGGGGGGSGDMHTVHTSGGNVKLTLLITTDEDLERVKI